jgi:hypothetical protein
MRALKKSITTTKIYAVPSLDRNMRAACVRRSQIDFASISFLILQCGVASSDLCTHTKWSINLYKNDTTKSRRKKPAILRPRSLLPVLRDAENARLLSGQQTLVLFTPLHEAPPRVRVEMILVQRDIGIVDGVRIFLQFNGSHSPGLL